MFKVGDKVQDSETGLFGTVIRVKSTLTGYPVVVDFGAYGSSTYTITYTTTGNYDTQKSRRIALINSEPTIVEITQTFIQIKEDDIFILLPLASTSFKIKHAIIVATHNNKEYTIHTPDVTQIRNQLLNPTKKEIL